MNPTLVPIRPPREAYANPLLRVLDPPLPELRWAALGDSFTAPPGEIEGWVDLVAAEIRDSGTELELLNLARDGTVADGVAREQLPAALAAEPGLVTVICGGNDVIRSVRPDLTRFRREYEGVLGALRRSCPRVPVLTATYPEVLGRSAMRARTRRRIRDGLRGVNAVVRDAARRFEAHLVDFADHPGRHRPAYLSADGIHPSAAGHQEAAAVVLARLREVLPIGVVPGLPEPSAHLEELW